MLHMINKSPSAHRCLRDCLRMCAGSDVIVLLEDGVYAALDNDEFIAQMTARCDAIYALLPDAAARGIAPYLSGVVRAIDYADFVQLCCEHTVIQSWY